MKNILILLFALSVITTACKKPDQAPPPAMAGATTPSNPVRDVTADPADESFSASGTATASLKIRSLPSADAPMADCQHKNPAIKCEPNDYSCGFDKMPPTFAEGAKLKINAKTEKKYAVGKWNNVWYRIRPEAFSAEGYPSSCKGEAWVFGEFVKLNEDK